MRKRGQNVRAYIVDLLDCNKPYLDKRIYIIVVAVMLLLFTMFNYTDIAITTRNGINVWNSIFDGSFFRFYSNNLNLDIAGGRYGNYSAMYNIVVYLLFAVWDFPLWLCEQWSGIDTLLYWEGFLYAKCILLPFVFFTIAQVKGICKELHYNEEQTSWAWILFVTSLFSFSCIVLVGQYDIIAISFMLSGIRHYLRNEKLGFFAAFSIALLFKLFALLAFFALLIMKEKRILAIIRKTILISVPYIITEAIFYVTDYPAKVKMLESTVSLTSFLETKPFMASLMYFYLGIFLILLVFCYCYVLDFSTADSSKPVFVCFLVFAAFFAGCYANPYWIIMLEPWACILLVQDVRYTKLRQIFELLFTGGYLTSSYCIHSWTFSIALVKYSWLGAILESFCPTEGTFGDVFSVSAMFSNLNNPEVIAAYGLTVFMVSLLVFILLCSDWFLKKTPVIQSGGLCKPMVGLRFALGVTFTVLPIACYLYV